jgi:predicted nucleotidyltransferase
MSPEATNKLSAALALVPTMTAAYLFGSAARGKERGGSDVDIAVFFTARPDLDIIEATLTACESALERDDMDLVVLNTASTVLAFEAISGRRILCLSPERIAAFESLTAREYESEMARLGRAYAYYAQKTEDNA